MPRWILMSWVMVLLSLALAACGTPTGSEGEAASPPPTTNPMGQQPTVDTPGAAAEERKASGY